MKRSVLIFFICITSFLQAQDLPEPMRPKRIVNDFTQLFSPQQQQALEQKLRNFNDTSSTQIAIVTVPTLQGYAPSDYAQRLAEKWGVGQKGKDNGVLLLIKPKSRTEKGQVAIAVGYGLEGVIPMPSLRESSGTKLYLNFNKTIITGELTKRQMYSCSLPVGIYSRTICPQKRKWQCRSDHHSYLDPISPASGFSEEKKGIPQVAMEVEESLPYFSEVSAVAAAISVLSAGVAEASEVSAEGVSAVAGPVEAGKTIKYNDNANTGQYPYVHSSIKARRKAWNICLPDITSLWYYGRLLS